MREGGYIGFIGHPNKATVFIEEIREKEVTRFNPNYLYFLTNTQVIPRQDYAYSLGSYTFNKPIQAFVHSGVAYVLEESGQMRVLDVKGDGNSKSEYNKFVSGNNYNDIVKFERQGFYLVLLRRNGRFVVIGDKGSNNDYGVKNFYQYASDIKDFAQNGSDCIAIRFNGSFTNGGRADSYNYKDTSNLHSNNEKILSFNNGIYLLKSDGSIFSTNPTYLDLSHIRDYDKVVMGNNKIVAIIKDGRVKLENAKSSLKTQVSTWENVVDVATYNESVFAIDKDGKLLYTIDDKFPVLNATPNKAFDYQEGKTELRLGELSNEGQEYYYKSFGVDESSIVKPKRGDLIDSSWILCRDRDTIRVDDQTFIGVAEVNSSGEIIRFSISRAQASKNK